MNWPDMYLKKIGQSGGVGGYLERKEKRSAGALIARMQKHLTPGSRILEVGTGTGAISTLLSGRGFDVKAIDSNQEMVGIAKKILGTRNKSESVFLVDAEDIVQKFGPDSFDCVISHGMLEHYSDKKIRHFLRLQLVVAPLVIFVVPTSRMSKKYRAKGFGDERYLSTEYWQKLIREDCVVKDIFGFGFKETNLPTSLEILLKNNTVAKLLAPWCGLNEFWIGRR